MRLTIPKHLRRFKTYVSKQILTQPRSGLSLATMWQARVLISLSCHWLAPTALLFSNPSLFSVAMEHTTFIREFKPSLMTATEAAMESVPKSLPTERCTHQLELWPRTHLRPQNMYSTLTSERGSMDLHSFHSKWPPSALSLRPWPWLLHMPVESFHLVQSQAHSKSVAQIPRALFGPPEPTPGT